jgi:hypothetical protein
VRVGLALVELLKFAFIGLRLLLFKTLIAVCNECASVANTLELRPLSVSSVSSVSGVSGVSITFVLRPLSVSSVVSLFFRAKEQTHL